MDKKKKTINPLSKRVMRELVGDWRKYLVLFLLLAITIGFVSGMYVANSSMLKAIDDGVSGYKLEYGHFELNTLPDEALLKAISSGEKEDVWAYASKVAREEADSEIEEKTQEELESKVKEQMEAAVKEQIEAAVKAQIEAGVQQQIPAGSEGYDQALQQAMDSMYEDALQQAMDSSYSEALQKVMDEKYDEALRTARESDEFRDAVENARSEAYEEIDKEIQKRRDEEEAKKTAEEKKAEEDFFPVPVTLFELFYKDLEQDTNKDGKKDAKIRVYKIPSDIDLCCVMEGSLPADETEVAIDRMHADNNGIKTGDKIRIQDKYFTVSGLIAGVNYSTLYDKNTDSMFDALAFDVGYVTAEAFNSFDVSVHYNYAWMYDNEKLGDHAIDSGASREDQEAQERLLSDNFMTALVTQSVVNENELQAYVPRYANKAVIFARNDISGDEVMAGILLYILIVMIAFIFGVTISSTITKEASAIGTLRASGYTKSEMVRHYISAPVVVTLISSIMGNVLGYTAFKFIVVGMYYNSYSLPTYVTVWNPEAFIRTTLIPVVIMILVTWIVIRRSMRFSPLKFLRHDLRSSKRKKAVRLPKVSFFGRFRLRVLLQNIPNYLVLFFGLAFVMVLLAFSFGLPSTLNSYTDSVADEMFCDYQYILKTTEDEDGNEITTSTPGAEKYSVTEVITTDGSRVGESITVYGVQDNSAYLHIDEGVKDGEVFVSSAYKDKFRLKTGDTIKLKKRFSSDLYTFTIKGITDYTGGLTVIMPQEAFNRTFGLRKGSFSGYLSNEEIKDIDEKNIAASVTVDDVMKISRQLNHSMGDYMKIFQVVCFVLALILIYMLTKVIIERNENAISMVKILGYENKEIGSLYLVTTTWFVLISAVITAFVGVWGLGAIWVAYLNTMDGWLPVHFGVSDYLCIISITFGAYLVVMLLDFLRIKRIPMEEALKNVE